MAPPRLSSWHRAAANASISADTDAVITAQRSSHAAKRAVSSSPRTTRSLPRRREQDDLSSSVDVEVDVGGVVGRPTDSNGHLPSTSPRLVQLSSVSDTVSSASTTIAETQLNDDHATHCLSLSSVAPSPSRLIRSPATPSPTPSLPLSLPPVCSDSLLRPAPRHRQMTARTRVSCRPSQADLQSAEGREASVRPVMRRVDTAVRRPRRRRAWAAPSTTIPWRPPSTGLSW